jgi:hypothetical protein
MKSHGHLKITLAHGYKSHGCRKQHSTPVPGLGLRRLRSSGPDKGYQCIEQRERTYMDPTVLQRFDCGTLTASPYASRGSKYEIISSLLGKPLSEFQCKASKPARKDVCMIRSASRLASIKEDMSETPFLAHMAFTLQYFKGRGWPVNNHFVFSSRIWCTKRGLTIHELHYGMPKAATGQ